MKRQAAATLLFTAALATIITSLCLRYRAAIHRWYQARRDDWAAIRALRGMRVR